MSSTKRRALLAAAAAAVLVFTALRLPETRHDVYWDNHRSRTRNHTIAGLGPAEEGAWRGSYFFVQLADPQLGMLHRDASWREELAMLALAVDHVNRLKPRFVVVSGDLINGFRGSQPSPTKWKPSSARSRASTHPYRSSWSRGTTTWGNSRRTTR